MNNLMKKIRGNLKMTNLMKTLKRIVNYTMRMKALLKTMGRIKRKQLAMILMKMEILLKQNQFQPKG